MDTILDINGIQTITSKDKITCYKEMIEECEMEIFKINQQIYEDSVSYPHILFLEKKLLTNKAMVNRLTQRIYKLENNGN